MSCFIPFKRALSFLGILHGHHYKHCELREKLTPKFHDDNHYWIHQCSIPSSRMLIIMRLAAIFSVSFSTMFAGNDVAVIRKVLTSSKTIALIGASPKPDRPSNYVMKYLLDRGYNVIPVNPGLEGKEIHGQLVYGSLSSIPEPVDMVDIFRNSEAVPPIVEEAIAVGAKSIWMQVGVINQGAAETATKAGLDVVMNDCPKIQMPLLGISGPSSSSSSTL